MSWERKKEKDKKMYEVRKNEKEKTFIREERKKERKKEVFSIKRSVRKPIS